MHNVFRTLFAAVSRAAFVVVLFVLKMLYVNGITSRACHFVCVQKDMSAMASINAPVCRRRVIYRIIAAWMLNVCSKLPATSTSALAIQDTMAMESIACWTRIVSIFHHFATRMQNAYPHMLDINANAISVSKALECGDHRIYALFWLFFVARIGFIGNGSHCEVPIRHGVGFLLLSQGVATVKIPFSGRPGVPISMAGVRIPKNLL